MRRAWIYNGAPSATARTSRGCSATSRTRCSATDTRRRDCRRSPSRPTSFGFSRATIYTAPSGSIVFATGSMQWSWGFDARTFRTRVSSVLDPRVQTTTRNIVAHKFADHTPAASGRVERWPSGQGRPVLVGSRNATNYNVYRATTTAARGARPYRTGMAALSFADTVPVSVVNCCRSAPSTAPSRAPSRTRRARCL